ncbi:hypothetical protein ABT369_25805 [Dactylosporangium sp. NPDC000244]|uniref:RICIN domain-containing protein n=1 Tax=Dactylosporangium sp. NPDC000244 TaxID=3154365 RepID=UPI0033346719
MSTAARRARRRRLIGVGVAALAAAAAVLADPAPAHAYVGTNILRSYQTGWCLNSDAPGTVNSRPCSTPIGSNKRQMWEPIYLRHDTSDWVMLRNVATNQCLQADAPWFEILTVGCVAGVGPAWKAEGTWQNVIFRQWPDNAGRVPISLATDATHDVFPKRYDGSNFDRWRYGG